MSSTPQEPQLPQIPVSQAPATPQVRPRIEDPPWSGWDVVFLVVFALVVLVVSLLSAGLVARAVLFPSSNLIAVMSFPLVAFLAQVFAYLVILAIMVRIATRREGKPFAEAIRWNWPSDGLPWLMLLGLVTYVALLGVAPFLPVPKKNPFEEFLKRPIDAYALAFLAVTLGPLLEELLFRGFLYPVLARRVGVTFGVCITAILFGLMHYPEYSAWGPVLLVFLAGLVFTIVRAWRKSVAASFVTHVVYNGVQMGIAFVHTSGFRHLEKLTH